MAFFNFSISDPADVAKQVELLQSKFNEWRLADVSQLKREREISGYVLEALCSYQYKPTDNPMQVHPAGPVLKTMMEYLKGYTIRANKDRTAIVIFSPRDTYVAELVYGTDIVEDSCNILDKLEASEKIFYDAVRGDVL